MNNVNELHCVSLMYWLCYAENRSPTRYSLLAFSHPLPTLLRGVIVECHFAVTKTMNSSSKFQEARGIRSTARCCVARALLLNM